MIRTLHRSVTIAICALAATLAYPASPAAEEHVGINAERGDPARWYVPADTPRLLYDTQVKEARAALAEATKECRSLQGGRTDCVAQANAVHRRDLEDARLLLNGQGGATRAR
jgi:hypothetical protein